MVSRSEYWGIDTPERMKMRYVFRGEMGIDVDCVFTMCLPEFGHVCVCVCVNAVLSNLITNSFFSFSRLRLQNLLLECEHWK